LLKETLKYRYVSRPKSSPPLLKHSHKMALSIGITNLYLSLAAAQRSKECVEEARHHLKTASSEMEKRYSGRKS
jgi:hypothetical protein